MRLPGLIRTNSGKITKGRDARQAGQSETGNQSWSGARPHRNCQHHRRSPLDNDPTWNRKNPWNQRRSRLELGIIVCTRNVIIFTVLPLLHLCPLYNLLTLSPHSTYYHYKSAGDTISLLPELS